MSKKNEIETPLYNATIKCFFNKESFEKHHNKHIGEVDMNCDGICSYYYNKKGKVVIIVGVFKDNVLTLVHELVHVCSMIFSTHGILYDTENDEPYAYLYQHLFYEINELLYEHYNKEK